MTLGFGEEGIERY